MTDKTRPRQPEDAPSWDPHWEEIFRRHDWGRYPSEHVVRFVARHWYAAPDRAAIRILDLGCATGAHCWYMAREGFTVSGIDGSATAIEKLKDFVTREGLAVESVAGDYTTLPWGDSVFDGVIDNVSLCHNTFEMSERAVDEVLRVLRPGGFFFSSSFTDRCWGYGSGAEVEPGGFRSLSEGPFASTGFCRFMTRSQVLNLYRRFCEISIETCSWTLQNLSKSMELWLVTCRKAGVLTA